MAKIEEIISDLDRLERNADAVTKKLAAEIRRNVTENVHRWPGIRTRAFINSINEHPLFGEHHYQIDNSDNPDVFYSGFLEFQTANRGDNGVRPGRYYFERGILQTDFENEFDVMINDSLINARKA
jgi:hypothetical protein